MQKTAQKFRNPLYISIIAGLRSNVNNMALTLQQKAGHRGLLYPLLPYSLLPYSLTSHSQLRLQFCHTRRQLIQPLGDSIWQLFVAQIG